MQFAGPGVFGPPRDRAAAVHDNLRRLGLDVVYLRTLTGIDEHAAGTDTLTPQFEALAGLQQQGLIRHLGVSTGRGMRTLPCSRCGQRRCPRLAAHRRGATAMRHRGCPGHRSVTSWWLPGAGYARASSSTGMVRTPAVCRSYSAKPG